MAILDTKETEEKCPNCGNDLVVTRYQGAYTTILSCKSCKQCGYKRWEGE